MALITLQTQVLQGTPLAYDGHQLRPHFIREHFGLLGDAAVAFRGPCQVETEALVDLEDRALGAHIRAREMVHFLVELFGWSLPPLILLQRLWCACCAARVRSGLSAAAAATVQRRGDDIFVAGSKLTVSIATVSPVSGLIHLGVNVDPEGAPVKACGLQQLGLDPDELARGLLDDLASELQSCALAQAKVRPVFDQGSGS